ncbi:hypothetical protein [uncultured Salinibacterium sp.]|uniref:hypothetical protein n=1 Tax=uncultured Salinibacterium sp. TaxID=459274 RepID=UPI0030DBA4F8
MSVVINYMSADSIAKRRAELLDRANLSLDELRVRDERYMLAPSEQSTLRELEDLDYLEKVS